MEGLRKEGRGESQRESSPTQRPKKGRSKGEGLEQKGSVELYSEEKKDDREERHSHNSPRQSAEQRQRSQRSRKTGASP